MLYKPRAGALQARGSAKGSSEQQDSHSRSDHVTSGMGMQKGPLNNTKVTAKASMPDRADVDRSSLATYHAEGGRQPARLVTAAPQGSFQAML